MNTIYNVNYLPHSNTTVSELVGGCISSNYYFNRRLTAGFGKSRLRSLLHNKQLVAVLEEEEMMYGYCQILC